MAFLAPPPPPADPQPFLYAAGHLVTEDGFVSSIHPVARFAGAFALDPGQIMVFFAETLPDTTYLVRAYDGPIQAWVEPGDKAEAFFIVNVTDQAGEPVDTAALSIEVVRII